MGTGRSGMSGMSVGTDRRMNKMLMGTDRRTVLKLGTDHG